MAACAARLYCYTNTTGRRLRARRLVLNARDALQALLEEVEDEEALLLEYIMGNRIPLTSSQRRRGIP